MKDIIKPSNKIVTGVKCCTVDVWQTQDNCVSSKMVLQLESLFLTGI